MIKRQKKRLKKMESQAIVFLEKNKYDKATKKHYVYPAADEGHPETEGKRRWLYGKYIFIGVGGDPAFH